MIKAVKTSLILILLCGGSISQVHAQAAAATAAQDAELEAVRRQGNTILMRKTIQDARDARARGETQLAIQKYQAAWELSQNLVNVDPERQQIISELVPIRLDLMKKAQSVGDLDEADKQVNAALRISPSDPAVRKAKAENDERVASQVGRRPSGKVTGRADEFRQERINTSTLVQDARFLIEQGRLDEAELLLKQAAKNDPEHRAAFYYLNLIKEQRYAQEARKREISVKDRMVDIEKSWNEPMGRELLPTPNAFARTNMVSTSPARQALYRKLETINIDDFPVPSDLDLVEVLKELNTEIRKRDPGGRGLNLIISQAADRPSPIAQAGAIDPLTGLPAAPAAAGSDIDVEKFKIKFDPPIRNVTLGQFLDALVTVAKPPEGAPSTAGLKYSVEDYAIVFSQRVQEPEQFFTRTFKLDPNTFRQGLEGVFFSANPFQGLVISQGGGAGGGGGGGGAGQNQNGQGGGPGGFFSFGGSQQQGGGGGGGGGGGQNGQGTGITYVTTLTNLSTLQSEVRAFFTAAGVDFPTNNVGVAGGGVPGGFGQGGGGLGTGQTKALFFNDRTGVLFVRASLRDLDIIENALHALNVAPPQVSIEAKFAEFSQNDERGLGFNWFLGNMLLANGKTGLQGGSAPSFTGSQTTANPSGAFPNPVIPRLDSDENVTSGFGQAAKNMPSVLTFTGILTQPQFRVAINAIENRSGVDLLSAPTITTLSGRQARISVEETATIIVGLQVQGLGQGGVQAAGATP